MIPRVNIYSVKCVAVRLKPELKQQVKQVEEKPKSWLCSAFKTLTLNPNINNAEECQWARTHQKA